MREAAEGDRQCLSLGITVEEVPEFYMSLKSKNWSESPWSFRGTLKTTQGYGCVGRTPADLSSDTLESEGFREVGPPADLSSRQS